MTVEDYKVVAKIREQNPAAYIALTDEQVFDFFGDTLFAERIRLHLRIEAFKTMLRDLWLSWFR